MSQNLGYGQWDRSQVFSVQTALRTPVLDAALSQPCRIERCLQVVSVDRVTAVFQGPCDEMRRFSRFLSILRIIAITAVLKSSKGVRRVSDFGRKRSTSLLISSTRRR